MRVDGEQSRLVSQAADAAPKKPHPQPVVWNSKPLTLKEIRALGMEEHIMDRSTHPGYYASSWPTVGRGVETLGEKTEYRMPHIAHNSVLVVAISNDWQEGCWWRLQNMLRYSEQHGITVALEETSDMSTMPADAIGIMRACAAMLAVDSGFEWCLLLDTDCKVEEDTLVRLIAHDRPVVYPICIAEQDDYPGTGLSSPMLKSGSGLVPVVWSVMSCMLFNTKVFNCLAPYAWHGHDFHFAQNLAHFGHRIYVDTDTVVKVTRGPARWPVTKWAALWEKIGNAYEKRRTNDRHREPPPGFDPAFSEGTVDESGVYWAMEEWKRLGVNGPMAGNPTARANGKEPDAKP